MTRKNKIKKKLSKDKKNRQRCRLFFLGYAQSTCGSGTLLDSILLNSATY